MSNEDFSGKHEGKRIFLTKTGKVSIMMMGVGNSPKLQKPKFSADKMNTLMKINMFVRAQLKSHIKPDDSIILYVKS